MMPRLLDRAAIAGVAFAAGVLAGEAIRFAATAYEKTAASNDATAAHSRRI